MCLNVMGLAQTGQGHEEGEKNPKSNQKKKKKKKKILNLILKKCNEIYTLINTVFKQSCID